MGWIATRILDEKRKHEANGLDWALIAEKKIIGELMDRGLITPLSVSNSKKDTHTDTVNNTVKGCGKELTYDYYTEEDGRIKVGHLGHCGDKLGFPNGEDLKLCKDCKKLNQPKTEE